MKCTPQKAQNKLPLKEIVLDAFRITWQKRVRIIQAVALPAIGLVAIQMISIFFNRTYVSFLLTIIESFVFVLLAVTCHRLILMGDDSIPNHGILKFTSRELRFLVWGWALPLAAALIIAFTGGIFSAIAAALNSTAFFKIYMWYFNFFILAPGGYFLARLILIFPAVAIDQHPSTSWAWNLSRGNGWRLFVLLWVLPLGTSFLRKPLVEYKTVTFGNLLYSVIGCIITVIGVAMLSLSYKALTQNIEDVKSASSPAERKAEGIR